MPRCAPRAGYCLRRSWLGSGATIGTWAIDGPGPGPGACHTAGGGGASAPSPRAGLPIPVGAGPSLRRRGLGRGVAGGAAARGLGAGDAAASALRAGCAGAGRPRAPSAGLPNAIAGVAAGACFRRFPSAVLAAAGRGRVGAGTGPRAAGVAVGGGAAAPGGPAAIHRGVAGAGPRRGARTIRAAAAGRRTVAGSRLHPGGAAGGRGAGAPLGPAAILRRGAGARAHLVGAPGAVQSQAVALSGRGIGAGSRLLAAGGAGGRGAGAPLGPAIAFAVGAAGALFRVRAAVEAVAAPHVNRREVRERVVVRPAGGAAVADALVAHAIHRHELDALFGVPAAVEAVAAPHVDRRVVRKRVVVGRARRAAVAGALVAYAVNRCDRRLPGYRLRRQRPTQECDGNKALPLHGCSSRLPETAAYPTSCRRACFFALFLGVRQILGGGRWESGRLARRQAGCRRDAGVPGLAPTPLAKILSYTHLFPPVRASVIGGGLGAGPRLYCALRQCWPR